VTLCKTLRIHTHTTREDEFDLRVILEGGETLKNDGTVSRSVCGRDGEEEDWWCCGRGFMKKRAYGEDLDVRESIKTGCVNGGR